MISRCYLIDGFSKFNLSHEESQRKSRHVSRGEKVEELSHDLVIFTRKEVMRV